MDNHIRSLASHTTYIKKPIGLMPTAQENHTHNSKQVSHPHVSLSILAPLWPNLQHNTIWKIYISNQKTTSPEVPNGKQFPTGRYMTHHPQEISMWNQKLHTHIIIILSSGQ